MEDIAATTVETVEGAASSLTGAVFTRENLIFGGGAVVLAAVSFSLGYYFGKRRDAKVIKTFTQETTATAPASDQQQQS